MTMNPELEPELPEVPAEELSNSSPLGPFWPVVLPFVALIWTPATLIAAIATAFVFALWAPVMWSGYLSGAFKSKE